MQGQKKHAFLKAVWLCTVASSLSACALGTKFEQMIPKKKKSVTEKTINRGHVVNSSYGEYRTAASTRTNESSNAESLPQYKPLENAKPYAPAPRVAATATPKYSPLPPAKHPFPKDSPLTFAPLAKTLTRANDAYPPALRGAQSFQGGFSPLPEIIKTAESRPFASNLPVAIALAPITITDPGPGISDALNAAKASVHIDPALIRKGHFERAVQPYQVLSKPTAEPIKPGVESFRQAIAAAYQTSPRLASERTRLKETDENYVQARSQGRVSARAEAEIDYALRRTPARSFFGSTAGFDTVSGKPREANLIISKPLYQGGRVKALKDQAKSSILAARERLRDTEQSITVSAATAYSDLIRDRYIASVRREDVRLVLRQEQAAKDRFEIGIGTKTDIYQAQARVAESEINRSQAQAQLAITTANYTRVVGYPPLDLQDIPALNIPKTVDDAIKIARTNNPRFRSITRDFDTAYAAIKVADAAGSPTIALTGTATAERGQLTGLARRDDASIALELRVPIFSGGANQSRKRAAIATKDRLYYEVLDADRAIKQIITELWADHRAAKQNFRDAQAQVDFAQIAYDGVKDEQLLGQRDILDVLNAERELQNSKAQRAAAKRNIDAAAFQLLSTMGVFDAHHLALPVALYDPAENLNAVAHSRFSKKTPKAVIKDKRPITPPTDLPPAPPL